MSTGGWRSPSLSAPNAGTTGLRSVACLAIVDYALYRLISATTAQRSQSELMMKCWICCAQPSSTAATTEAKVPFGFLRQRARRSIHQGSVRHRPERR